MQAEPARGTGARKHHEISSRGWHLWRLSDEEYACLVRYALPIQTNYHLLFRLASRGPSLLRAFLALQEEFGPDTGRHDPDKSSFSFPLLLTLGPTALPAYLLAVTDIRCTVNVAMARLCRTEPGFEARTHYHDPDPCELSQEQMDGVVSYLYGFLDGYGGCLERQHTAPFFRCVPTELYLYGHDGAAGFDREFGSDSPDGSDPCRAFRAAVRELEAKYPRRPHGPAGDAERLIAWITSGDE